jgi:hypothetical protein
MSQETLHAREAVFLDWLHAQGVQHGSCGIGRSSTSGRYAIAVKDIAAGEVVIQVLHRLAAGGSAKSDFGI